MCEHSQKWRQNNNNNNNQTKCQKTCRGKFSSFKTDVSYLTVFRENSDLKAHYYFIAYFKCVCFKTYRKYQLIFEINFLLHNYCCHSTQDVQLFLAEACLTALQKSASSSLFFLPISVLFGPSTEKKPTGAQRQAQSVA